MRYLINSMYNLNSTSYNRPISIPTVTPDPTFEFTFSHNGTTEGKESIRKFKTELPRAMKTIIYLYKKAMEKDGIKTPPWIRLNLKFNVEATKLYRSSEGGLAALLYETSDPREFNLKIDYRWMKNPAVRSNIVHEVGEHPIERLSGKDVPESVTEKRVIDALYKTGDMEAATTTEKGSMYL